MDESTLKTSLVSAFVKREGDYAYKNWHTFHIAEYKDGGRDLSTNLDQEIESSFYDFCQQHFPDFGFKGEEQPHLNKPGANGYVWHIDPIDGTKNFASGVPLWSVTVCLVKAGEPVFGIIYNPVSKQFYSAIKGSGAYLNGKPLHITHHDSPSSSQLAIDFFMPQTGQEEQLKQNALLAELYGSFYRVRSIGSGSLSLAWLAQGHFGAYFSWGLTDNKFTDVAAGLIIAKEAGAIVDMRKLKSGKYVLIVGPHQAVDHLTDMATRIETEQLTSEKKS